MQVSYSLKQGLIALVALTTASTVRAETVKIDYTNSNGIFAFNESFTIDTTAGVIVTGGLGPVLKFSIANDTSNNTVFDFLYPGSYSYFPANSNAFGTGNGQAFFDGLMPPIWSGVGTTVNLAPGDSYATIHGGTLTVSSVPEISTWAMMLAGFAALGFVGYRRRVASAA
jgi:hypothetical protein